MSTQKVIKTSQSKKTKVMQVANQIMKKGYTKSFSLIYAHSLILYRDCYGENPKFFSITYYAEKYQSNVTRIGECIPNTETEKTQKTQKYFDLGKQAQRTFIKKNAIKIQFLTQKTINIIVDDEYTDFMSNKYEYAIKVID